MYSDLKVTVLNEVNAVDLRVPLPEQCLAKREFPLLHVVLDAFESRRPQLFEDAELSKILAGVLEFLLLEVADHLIVVLSRHRCKKTALGAEDAGDPWLLLY